MKITVPEFHKAVVDGFAQREAQAKEVNDQLKADNADLLEALKDTLDFCEHHSNRWDGARGKHIFSVVEAARAAIKKHGGQS